MIAKAENKISALKINWPTKKINTEKAKIDDNQATKTFSFSRLKIKIKPKQEVQITANKLLPNIKKANIVITRNAVLSSRLIFIFPKIVADFSYKKDLLKNHANKKQSGNA